MKSPFSLFQKEQISKTYTPFIEGVSDSSIKVQEAFKGLSLSPTLGFKTIKKEVGEEHPYDFLLTLKAYQKDGLVHAAVDKYVDFIVGPGFYVSLDDERAQEIVEMWMKQNDFDTILRSWVREALITGNSFLEIAEAEGIVVLKQLNSISIYIKKDEYGVVEGYTQWLGNLLGINKKKEEHFEVDEIAHLPINMMGDGAYGLGIVLPVLNTLKNKDQLVADMHMLVGRKANAPLHAKVGTPEIIPSAADLSTFSNKLAWMKNNHEYVTDALVEMSVIDFGKIGENFTEPLKYDLQEFYYTMQIPSVLMGVEGVPEGLAKIQLEAFDRRIKSLQAEIEPIIEKKILQRVLQAHGLEDVALEFEWGQPSETEKKEEITKITELLKLFTLSDIVKKRLEFRLSQLLGLDISEEEIDAEQAKRRELETKQPIIPGSQRKEYYVANRELLLEEHSRIQEDTSVYEWIQTPLLESLTPDFNFKKFLSLIIGVTAKDDFEMLRAENKKQEKAGYLSKHQVEAVRNSLLEGFNEGSSLRKISEKISEKANITDLYKTDTKDRIIKNNLGEPIIQLSKNYRSMIIAKTETTRITNIANLKDHANKGYTKEKWITSNDERVCELCGPNDGKIFLREEINETEDTSLPRHIQCRCTTQAVVSSLEEE